MRAAVALVLLFAALRARGWSYCSAAGACVCRHHDTDEEDFARQHVDCSYGRSLAAANLTLPPQAYSLDLSANGLAAVRAGQLPRSHALQELALSNNEIAYIEPDALPFPQLRRLDLSGNRLDGVGDGLFKSITRLEYLNLANNRFASFDELGFHPLRALQEVVLDGNALGAALGGGGLFDRDGYGLTKRLRKLSIARIGLSAPAADLFADAYELRELRVAGNRLTEPFPTPFTLELLDLSDNPIARIAAEDFADMSALRVLRLNNLSIAEVPAHAFAALRDLATLQLERNLELTEFSVLAFGQEVLEDPDDFLLAELSLRSSRLRTLDARLLAPLGRVRRLDLQGNPWHCDCRVAWLKQLHVKRRDQEHLRCNTPKSLFNSKIIELNERQWRCGAGRGRAALAAGLLASAMFVAAAALWLLWYLPACQARAKFATSMYSPSAVYAVLPVDAAAAPSDL